MPDATAEDHPSLRGIHVLLVEDDADTRELLRTVLEYAGALVSTAGSARAGLRALESIRPDVLVSNIMMPGEDGCWLIRQVRGRPDTAALPALAITALTGREDRQRVMAAGFDQYLAKPLDPWEFCRAVAVLARRR